MEQNSIGKRITFLREHFGLKRKEFIKITNSSNAAISRLERDKAVPSENFLNALMVHFLADPDWIKTGEGEMLLTPEKYMDKGISIMGAQKFSEGLKNILKDPRFAEFQSYVISKEIMQGNQGHDLEAYLQYILGKWYQGDETVRGWLMIQLGIAFQEVAKRLEEEKKE
jgi:transcriptional regulator with XRE-family HTH domain